jgi:hypothetical protein
MEQLGGLQRFHEFVLSGNEQSLTRYYQSKHQSPILGSEAFIERVIVPGAPAREHPRYERRVVEAAPERVISEVAREYEVARRRSFTG